MQTLTFPLSQQLTGIVVRDEIQFSCSKKMLYHRATFSAAGSPAVTCESFREPDPDKRSTLALLYYRFI